MNTDERDERIRRIRERRHAATLPANQRGLLHTASWVDIDFLLSLLDGQAAPMTLSPCNTPAQGFNAEREKKAAEHAATRMRDLCLDAIKSLRATPHGAAYNNAINDAIHKVESLTLDQVEQKQ